MSDLTDKTPQNKLLMTNTRGSVEIHEEDSSPERGDFGEPPRSVVQDKEATRNLESPSEEEDNEEEPTAGDICKMIKSMQRTQEHQMAQQQVLVSQHLAMK
ncbi:hypothetical protein M5689_018800 [Euphorbia peplus]|nr:hypothetical protein M5689_018800 [Euphorbia peplus]